MKRVLASVGVMVVITCGAAPAQTTIVADVRAAIARNDLKTADDLVANTLQPWQSKIAYSLGGVSGRGAQPSHKQAIQGRKLLLEAIRLGFGHEHLSKDMVEALGSAEPAS